MFSDIILLPLISIFLIILGFFMLLQNLKGKQNIFYGLCVISLGAWVLGIHFFGLTDDQSIAVQLARICATLGIISSVFFFFFCRTFQSEQKFSSSFSESMFCYIDKLFIILAIIYFPLTLSKYIVLSVKINGLNKLLVLDNTLYAGYIFFLCATFIASFTHLFITLKKSTGRTKKQIQYLLVGVGLTIFTIVIFNIIMPRFNLDYLYVGPLSSLFLFTFTATAIIKHRLMDISVIVSRTLAMLMAFIVFAFSYLALFLLNQYYISHQITTLFFLSNFLFFSLAFFFFQPLRLSLQTTTDRLILRGRYDYRKTLIELSEKIAQTLVLKDLLQIIFSFFSDTLEVGIVRLWIYKEDSETKQRKAIECDLKDGSSMEHCETVFDSPIFQNMICVDKQVLLRDKVQERTKDKNMPQEIKEKYKNLFDCMKKYDIEMIVPCVLHNRVVSVIALGKKLSEDDFSDEDINLIETFASQLAIAFENTKTYEEVYDELELTQKQVERSDRLAALGTLAAGVAHEIRNPMAAMVSHAELLKDRLDDKEYLTRFTKMLPAQIFRVLEIVNRILDFSRQRPPKFTAVDINKVINDMDFLLKGEKKKREVEIRYDLKAVGSIRADNNQISQILLNVIINGMQAMPAGGSLKIKTSTIPKENDKDGVIQIEIIDEGKGISKDNLEKIFDPFFTTRHEGTGLGLSTVYNMVKENNGSMEVESKPAEGTRFIITFPIME